MSARNGEALEAAAAEIEAAGAEALAVTAEATSQEDAESLCRRAVERFGRIDTFVDAVMVTVYAEVEELEPDELRRVLEVNFMGRALSYRAALPHLKASRGTFVDVNSALAYRGIPLQAAYCASKAAARAFFESARVELERQRAGVDLCLVLPGAMNTPQFDRARQKLGLQPQPVPPIYRPEVTAAAVLARLRAPGARAAGELGRAEAPLGPEALAAGGRSRPAPERLELPDDRRAEARRLARQPLGDTAGRSGRPWPLRCELARLECLDDGPAAPR